MRLRSGVSPSRSLGHQLGTRTYTQSRHHGQVIEIGQCGYINLALRCLFVLPLSLIGSIPDFYVVFVDSRDSRRREFCIDIVMHS